MTAGPVSVESLAAAEARFHMPVYGRQPVTFVRGSGCRLYDSDGREYLDFLAGIAVANVGHSHPRVVAAIREQAGLLMHASNLFYTEPQVRLAERLHGLLGWGKTFLSNSGAEANECAIKLARRLARERGEPARTEVVTALGSFHGRTLATLAATGQPAKQAPFGPLPAGFRSVPLGDVAALDAAVTKTTGVVLLEVVQGEAGVVPAPLEFLQAARRLCDERGALLVLDEVQTGLGRTGRWFAFEEAGVTPDVVTLAKALGAGLPIGACVAREDVADAFRPGDHATTFGGGPVVCAAALAVLDVIEAEDLCGNARRMGAHLVEALTAAVGSTTAVREIRGAGLLVAVELTGDWAASIVGDALARGLVVNNVRADVVRLAPPLVVSKTEVETAVETLAGVLERYGGQSG